MAFLLYWETQGGVVIQSLSHIWLFVTPWTAAHQASLSFTISWSLLKLMCTESVMPSNHLIHCHPLLLLLSIFPSIRVFPTSWFFPLRGQSIGASAAALVLPKNIQDWFSLGLTGWISLLSQGLSRVFSNTTVQKHQFFGAQSSLWSNSHTPTCLLENHSFDYTDFARKVMCLLFNMLSRFVIAFLPRSKCLLISQLQSPSTVTLEPKKIKSVTVSTTGTESDRWSLRCLPPHPCPTAPFCPHRRAHFVQSPHLP